MAKIALDHGKEPSGLIAPEQDFTRETGMATSLVIACGALAREILFLIKVNGWTHIDLTCLPASLHNRPDLIPARLAEKIDQAKAQGCYRQILVGYGDCGTGGAIDRLLAEKGASRIAGAHCYGFFAGLQDFDQLMEEEPGSFFLTDYLARHFETLIIKGLGIDRHPQLQAIYFANYRRLIYLAQTVDAALDTRAEQAARRLGLSYQRIQVGYGLLEPFLAPKETNKETNDGIGKDGLG